MNSHFTSAVVEQEATNFSKQEEQLSGSKSRRVLVEETLRHGSAIS